MAPSLGTSNVAFLDMAATQALMAQQVQKHLALVVARHGIGLDEFKVASVSLPESRSIPGPKSALRRPTSSCAVLPGRSWRST